MRLFFAAFPDPETRTKLSAAVRALRLPGAPTYHLPEKYHLTLLFLGKVSDNDANAVAKLGEAQRIGRISLRFDRWEYFGEANALVASTDDRPASLLQLRASLTAALKQRGIVFDDRPLRPHITVARKLTQAPVLPELSEFTCTFRAFSLVSSVTAPSGSFYTVVATWPLLDTAVRR
jgi:2'-5' RNA ligase